MSEEEIKKEKSKTKERITSKQIKTPKLPKTLNPFLSPLFYIKSKLASIANAT